jgi:hypothetical protein
MKKTFIRKAIRKLLKFLKKRAKETDTKIDDYLVGELLKIDKELRNE